MRRLTLKKIALLQVGNSSKKLRLTYFIICIAFFNSCKKDNIVQNQKIPVINRQDIKDWIQKNPASQLMQPD